MCVYVCVLCVCAFDGALDGDGDEGTGTENSGPLHAAIRRCNAIVTV